MLLILYWLLVSFWFTLHFHTYFLSTFNLFSCLCLWCEKYKLECNTWRLTQHKIGSTIKRMRENSWVYQKCQFTWGIKYKKIFMIILQSPLYKIMYHAMCKVSAASLNRSAWNKNATGQRRSEGDKESTYLTQSLHFHECCSKYQI